MHGRCCVWPWLIERCCTESSRFTHSRATIFTEVSAKYPEGSSIPLFKAILYSKWWVRKNCFCKQLVLAEVASVIFWLAQSRHKRALRGSRHTLLHTAALTSSPITNPGLTASRSQLTNGVTQVTRRGLDELVSGSCKYTLTAFCRKKNGRP